MKGGLVVAETQEQVEQVLNHSADEWFQEAKRANERLDEAQRHIQKIENTLGIQAALLCGFAAILGPNSIAISTNLFEAVSGQQVVVQPDLENGHLVFYTRTAEPTEAADDGE